MMLRFTKKKVGRTRKVYFGQWKLFEYQKARGHKEQKDLELQKSLEKGFSSRLESSLAKGSSHGLIVSLTSFGDRVNKVHIVLESILRQSRPPRQLLLWLDQNEYTELTLPHALSKARDLGVEVGFCENIRSYKKIIPTLHQFPDQTIVTIDDDVMYPPNFLALLEQHHLVQPDDIICYRAHRISFDQHGHVLPYSAWESRLHNVEPALSIFPTGAGGVLYPAGCFASEVMDATTFMNICPTADDIWLKAMTLKIGRRCCVVPGDNVWSDVPPYVDGTQEACLAEENVDEKNDVQLKAVFDRYDLWRVLQQDGAELTPANSS